MLNSPEAYIEAGRKSAEARNQRGEARAMFHTEWFRRARGLEQGEDKVEANRLFQAAYSEARHI